MTTGGCGGSRVQTKHKANEIGDFAEDVLALVCTHRLPQIVPELV